MLPVTKRGEETLDAREDQVVHQSSWKLSSDLVAHLGQSGEGTVVIFSESARESPN